jgi:hypothetical protein
MEPIRRSQLWEVGEQFGALNQVQGKPFGRPRIISCDVTDNVFETPSRAAFRVLDSRTEFGRRRRE